MYSSTDFWNDNPGTPLEVKTAKTASKSAFDRFQLIYQSLGWRENQGLIFNAVNLSKYSEVLMESIFAIEAYRMKRFNQLRESSRASFEYSRLPRLLLILIRIESRQNYVNECRRTDELKDEQFDARALLNVLSEVGRTMRLVSFASGLNKMTLEELLVRCYSRQILQQPRPEECEKQYQHFQLLFDCLMALDFTQRFREIRDPLSSSFFIKYKSKPIYKIFEMVKTHRDLTRGIDRFKQLPLQESNSPTFLPDHFNVQYIQEFGDLKVEWTDCLDDHLKIITGRNAIRIFSHPTFFYNFIDLHQYVPLLSTGLLV